MIELLIYLVVWLLVLVILFAIVKVAATEFGISGNWVRIVGYLIGLIFLLVLLNAFGLMGPPHAFKLR
jgi:hypothetical protein